ncbi:hypothetical protein ACLI1A_06105 [Flavobacterium sp. RHBU_3]|uniref:hypothetical protein n=1 Tax=Flavobacterium sp. RHBU_3 TaxID=3391184 RepID=UPI0039855EFE
MKKFLRKSTLFLLPFILLWGAIECMYRFVPNNYSEKYKGLIEYNNAEVYLLGNSHAFYGLHPEYMKNNAYNASNISQPLLIDKLIFDQYISKNKDVKALVLLVDYFTLGERPVDDPELMWRRYFYRHFYKLDVPGINSLNPQNYSLALSVRFNLTQENIKMYRAKGTLAECAGNGAAMHYGTSTEFSNPHMGEVIVEKHTTKDVVLKENTLLLEQLITSAKQKGIKVLLVTMPVSDHYRAYADAARLRKIQEVCHRMERFDNVKYLYLFEDKRFSNTDFYDVDHLNSVGAKKCSVIVDSTLTTLLTAPSTH